MNGTDQNPTGQQLCLAAVGIAAEIMSRGRANRDSRGGQFRASPPSHSCAGTGGRGPENTGSCSGPSSPEPLSWGLFAQVGQPVLPPPLTVTHARPGSGSTPIPDGQRPKSPPGPLRRAEARPQAPRVSTTSRSLSEPPRAQQDACVIDTKLLRVPPCALQTRGPGIKARARTVAQATAPGNSPRGRDSGLLVAAQEPRAHVPVPGRFCL